MKVFIYAYFHIFSDAIYRNLTVSMIQEMRNHRLEWIFINEATGIQSVTSMLVTDVGDKMCW